ncbi:MAG: hypothetical protein ACOYU0_02210 [Nitrospirota bacterium]
MKRYLVLVLGVLFVLSFAAIAFAQDKPEIKLGGELQIMGWYRNNIGIATRNPIDTPSSAFYNQRVKLGIEAKVSPNITGMIEFESIGTADPLTGEGERFLWGNFNEPQSTGVDFTQAWILYKGSGLFGFPTGLKIGHIPAMLGHGKFWNHTRYGDDGIILFADPNKQLHLGLITVKVDENSLGAPYSNANDIDAYAAVVVYKLDDKNNIGINWVGTNCPHADDFTSNYRQLNNLMLHGAGNVAGIGYKFETDFQFGYKDIDTKYRGTGIFLEVGYKVDPMNLRVSFTMGSGDATTDDSKDTNFVAFQGPDMNVGTFLYEYQVGSAGITNNTSTAGITNTTAYNIGLDVSPTKDLTLSLDGYFLRATKAVVAGGSKKVGTEVDAKLTYKVAKNLVYTVLAGYLNADDFYAPNEKSATAVRHELTLTF